MAKQQITRPTEAELVILNVLWDRGKSTVREVHDAVTASRDTAYTTVLTQLQVMVEKGLVVREDHHGIHLYRPKRTREATQRSLLDDLLDRAFGGSAAGMVMQLLTGRRTSRDELDAIRKLLDEKRKEDSNE